MEGDSSVSRMAQGQGSVLPTVQKRGRVVLEKEEDMLYFEQVEKEVPRIWNLGDDRSSGQRTVKNRRHDCVVGCDVRVWESLAEKWQQPRRSPS